MSEPAHSEAVVYRMFDADGRLLWVGMSVNAVQRMVNHRALRHWWPRVARITLEHFAGRKAAAAAEAAAIATENPEFNVAPGHPVAWDTRDELDERRAASAAHAHTRQGPPAEYKVRAPSACWPTNGTVECPNCGHRPAWFPKGLELPKVQCSRCRCTGFVSSELVA